MTNLEEMTLDQLVNESRSLLDDLNGWFKQAKAAGDRMDAIKKEIERRVVGVEVPNDEA